MDILKTQEVRRKRPGTFISSAVISRKTNTDDVLNKRKQVLDIPLTVSKKLCLNDLPNPSSFSKRGKTKTLRAKKRSSQMDTYLQLLKRKQTEFNWVSDPGLQEDDKSFYEDLIETSCNDINEVELYTVGGEAVVPQHLSKPKYENKYFINSAEVKRISNLETEQENTSNKVTPNLSKVLNISNEERVKYEDRVVPMKIYSSSSLTSSTVSRNPKVLAVSEISSITSCTSSSTGYKPNFSFNEITSEKTVSNLSKVLNVSNDDRLKYEERVVPIKIYSSSSETSSTVSKIPKAVFEISPSTTSSSSADGYKPNFSFNIYSEFAVNEVVPNIDQSTNLKTTVKNNNYPIFLNADQENQRKRTYQIKEPSLQKQTMYTINKQSFHGMYANFSRQEFESRMVNYERLLENESLGFSDKISNRNQRLSSQLQCYTTGSSFPQSVQHFSDSPGAENEITENTFY